MSSINDRLTGILADYMRSVAGPDPIDQPPGNGGEAGTASWPAPLAILLPADQQRPPSAPIISEVLSPGAVGGGAARRHGR